MSWKKQHNVHQVLDANREKNVSPADWLTYEDKFGLEVVPLEHNNALRRKVSFSHIFQNIIIALVVWIDAICQ